MTEGTCQSAIDWRKLKKWSLVKRKNHLKSTKTSSAAFWSVHKNGRDIDEFLVSLNLSIGAKRNSGGVILTKKFVIFKKNRFHFKKICHFYKKIVFTFKKFSLLKIFLKVFKNFLKIWNFFQTKWKENFFLMRSKMTLIVLRGWNVCKLRQVQLNYDFCHSKIKKIITES